jgi:magnesium transporter
MRFATLIGPDLRDLLREQPEQLREVLDEVHPEDLADIVQDFEPGEASQVIAHLPPEIAAPIFERLERARQTEILPNLEVKVAARLIESMSADDRADVVQELDADLRARILAVLQPEEARDVRELAKYPENTAGGLMTTDYIGVSEDMTVREAIEEVRKRAGEVETVYYIYVLHGEPMSPPGGAREGLDLGARKLLGVASLRDLLLGAPDQKISEVMTENVITVPPELDQEEVARTIAKYDLGALPVVDKFQRLLGVITFDDVMDVLVQEQTEDVQKLAGVEPVEEGYFDTGFWRFISARARWLVALFIGELFTSTALSRYEEAFKAVGTLVLFIPLVISSGGNSGSQSATIVIRAMAVGQIKDGDAYRVISREVGQGAVLGLILGAIGFVRAILWRPAVPHQLKISLIVALTLIAVVMIGTVVGSVLPMLLKRLRLDPAVSSTPFIASLVDVFGIVAYFSIARSILGAVIHAAGG